jgi:hypothetical protein
MFSKNCSPAYKNGGQNGIHPQRQAPIMYQLIDKNYTNNYVTRFYITMTVAWLLATVMGENKNNHTKNAGNCWQF